METGKKTHGNRKIWNMKNSVFSLYRFPFIRTRRICITFVELITCIFLSPISLFFSFYNISLSLSPPSFLFHTGSISRYTCALVKRPFDNSVYAVDFISILWDFIERTKMIAFLKDNLVLFGTIPKYKVSFVAIHWFNFITPKRIDDQNILNEWHMDLNEFGSIFAYAKEIDGKHTYTTIESNRIDHQTFELSLRQ